MQQDIVIVSAARTAVDQFCGMRIGMGCKAQAAANGSCHWRGMQRGRPPKPAPARPRRGRKQALMGLGRVEALQKALRRAGWQIGDVDLLELHETFAPQTAAVNKLLSVDSAKVNVNGGAIAIGHPIGASGCRILVTLLYEMQRRNARKRHRQSVHGGGMGVALALER